MPSFLFIDKKIYLCYNQINKMSEEFSYENKNFIGGSGFAYFKRLQK